MLNGMTASPETLNYSPEPHTTASGGLPHIPGYEVQGLIGRGGMGKVYRARHVALGRTVAIKVMTQEQDERLLARFRDEARAVAKLLHPNIAQLFDTGTADGRPYYSLEFADGGTLAGWWDGKPQDPAAVATVMETVARAIEHSHQHGILHRDLKPANVLLAAAPGEPAASAAWVPKVADFGLAKELPSAAPAASTLPGLAAHTRTGEIVGTPAYMPPEQASGVNSTLTPAADVYSLGAMLYEGLTGRPPFQAPDALQTLFLVLASDPVPPKTLQPKLPADLNTICLKCLEKQPRKRYATAGELADDLRRWQRGEPIVARPVGRVERAVKWAKRNRAGAALVGVSAALVLAVVGFGVWEAINAVRLREANEQLNARNDELARLNADLEKSKGETEAMLAFALEKMDEYHFTLSDRLRDLPQGEAVRIEVLEQARRALDDLYAANPRRETVWEYLMRGYQRLGNAYSQVGKTAEAAAAFTRSRAAAERLVDAHPDSPQYRAAWATVTFQLANTETIRGREAEAAPLLDAGEREAADLEASHPQVEEVIQLGLLATSRPAMRAAEAGAVDKLEAVYGRWAELNRRLARLHPDDPKYPLAAVGHDLTRGGLLAQLKRYDEAHALLAGAKATLDGVPGEGGTLTARLTRAAYHDAVANVHYQQDRPADADAAYRLALAEYERLVKDFPNSPNYRRSVVNTWFNIGMVWTFGGKPADGKAAYTKARDLAAELAKDYPDDAQLKQMLAGIEQSLRPPPPDKR
jgi:tetratricopeptide (TPR) repeat protein